MCATYLAPRAGSVFNDELKKTIDHYNSSILTATDDESKLAVIVGAIYDLHHLHLFLDANTRTLIILLLNRVLIQNGFVPATFDNIHCFVGHSKQELVVALKQAMQSTLDLVSGKKDVFEFNSANITEEFKPKYQDIIGNFTKAIDKALAPKSPNPSTFFAPELSSPRAVTPKQTLKQA